MRALDYRFTRTDTATLVLTGIVGAVIEVALVWGLSPSWTHLALALVWMALLLGYGQGIALPEVRSGATLAGWLLAALLAEYQPLYWSVFGHPRSSTMIAVLIGLVVPAVATLAAYSARRQAQGGSLRDLLWFAAIALLLTIALLLIQPVFNATHY